MTAKHRREDEAEPTPVELPDESAVFTVLFVCTANVVRSPIAERLLQARLPSLPPGARAEIVASSAGTHALVGQPMDPLAGLALRELGGNPNGHLARQLHPELAHRASLILTATTSQRDGIVRADRSVLRRTFALREFARLGQQVPLRRPGPARRRLVGRVRELAERRAAAPTPNPSADEIADPLGTSLEMYRFRAAQISAAVDGLLAALELSAMPSPRPPRH